MFIYANVNEYISTIIFVKMRGAKKYVCVHARACVRDPLQITFQAKTAILTSTHSTHIEKKKRKQQMSSIYLCYIVLYLLLTENEK